MRFSHSRIECFNKCPYQFKLRYVDRLGTIEDYKADNALVLGTALHMYIQESPENAWNYYKSKFPIFLNNKFGDYASEHFQNFHKMEEVAKKLDPHLMEDAEFEFKLETPEFIGFIDAITSDGKIYDFKYSNNADNYKESSQLSLYKFFYEKITGKKIKSLNYIMFGKTFIRQKKSERPTDFERRLRLTLSEIEPYVMEVEFKQELVDKFFNDCEKIKMTLNEYEKDKDEEKHFPKNKTRLCDWCEFQEFCERGLTYMLLPKNERRNLNEINKRAFWIYGGAFSGKTTFANKFDDPLMLNTDGNIKFVDAPYIPLKDGTVKEGRITKKVFAWDTFKQVIQELEAKENDFQTIVLDLVEDIYESCRLYMYDQLNISHESDDSFSAWDKITTEFLSTMRRFLNLDYKNIILISHESTQRDIMKRVGENVTAIEPNIRGKIALKLAGMVDLVGRVIVENGQHKLQFSTQENIFGGGRLGIKGQEIPLEYEDFISIYDEALGKLNSDGVIKDEPKQRQSRQSERRSSEIENEESHPTETIDEETDGDSTSEETTDDEVKEEPQRRSRRRK